MQPEQQQPEESEPQEEPRYFGKFPDELTGAQTVVVRSARRTRWFASFAVAWVAAWIRARARVAALKREQRHLRRRRNAEQFALGAAAYARDAAEVERLIARIANLDDEIAACGRAASGAIDAARTRTAGERAATARTEIHVPMGDPGFEPGTSALSERRSNQLS